MRRVLEALFFLGLLISGTEATSARDITGVWQGAAPSRHVVEISKIGSGSLKAQLYSAGNDPRGYTADTISFDGSALELAIQEGCGNNQPDGFCRFKGTLSPDGKSVVGTWATFGAPKPMTLDRATNATRWDVDPSPHKVHMVKAAPGIDLEVLDWGGTGRPLIFIPGLSNSGHLFDTVAPKFTDQHHVYAISRRGSGLSTWPDPATDNYSSDRLGDDVLAVMAALKLERPVLAGFSYGGTELSSVRSRYPEKVAGLVYLDAGYSYAYYTPENSVPISLNIFMDLNEMQAAAAEKIHPGDPQYSLTENKVVIQKLEAALPDFQRDLADARQELNYEDLVPPVPHNETARAKVADAIQRQATKYGSFNAPILAIFAMPKSASDTATPTERASTEAWNKIVATRVHDFETGHPGAHIVRLPDTPHLLWATRAKEMTDEMSRFMDGLR